MAQVFLHVGLPKSGTTFIQAVLTANKELLMSAGLLFPGAEGWKSQVRAVRDVREMPHVRFNHRQVVPGSWDRLAEEIRDWPGDALVSMEWLSRAEPAQIQRIRESLRTHELHIIFTVRDLGRVLPASWQESIVNRMRWTWPEFLAQTADESLSADERRFWRLHDLVPLTGRWTTSVPSDRIHVVTVPPAGAPPEALWQRFASVLGVTQVPVELEGMRRNEGLGLTATELLRRVNVRSRELKVSPTVHSKLLSQGLAKRGLSQLSAGEQRPRIPRELHEWVMTRYEQQAAGLKAAGVDLVGEVEDLRPDLSRHMEQPSDPTPEALLEAAVEGLIMMAQLRAEHDEVVARSQAEAAEALERLQRRHDNLTRRHAGTVKRWRARPFRSAISVYAHRSPLTMRLVRRVRRLGSS